MNSVGVRVNAPHVIHESIDGEVIVINLASGAYYSLKGSAAEVWEIINGAPSVQDGQIAAALAPAHDTPHAEVETSVAQFVAQLRDEGLVAEVEPTGVEVSASRNGGAAGAFVPPVLEKFTDMQDLVLLDPVHQVDATGWPQASPDAASQSNA